MKYARWIALFLPVLVVELLAYLVTPIVAMFIVKRERTDRVKLIDNEQHTMMREYLIPSLYYFQTHDNAVDEYWYGAFFLDSSFKWLRERTQSDYDNSSVLRYICRVMWMLRNNAYGFNYSVFGEGDEPRSERVRHNYSKKQAGWYTYRAGDDTFQLKWNMPLPKGYYMSINIGWKAHKGIPGYMYANRILGPVREAE